MHQPALVKSYDDVETHMELKIDSHGYYQDLNESGKEAFFREYKEAWNLADVDE